MKYYKSYLERQEISQETHKRLLALGENSLSTGRAVTSRTRWGHRWGALAACCALALGLGVWHLAQPAPPGGQTAADAIYPGIKDTYGPGEEPPSGFTVAEGPDGEKMMLPCIPYVDYQRVDGELAADAAPARYLIEGSFSQELTKEQIQRTFWGPEGKPEVENPKNDSGNLPWMLFWQGYTLTGSALYDRSGSLLWLNIWGENEEADSSFTLTLRPGELPLQCGLYSDVESTDVMGTPVTGWSREEGGLYTCCSEFMAGEVGVRFENSGGIFGSEYGESASLVQGGAQMFNALLVRQALSQDGGLYLDHLLKAEEVPEWRAAEFSSLEDARQEVDFVSYLPAEDLSGYDEFYSRMTYQEGSEHTLYLRWSWGYDDVTIRVELPEGDAEWGNLVDTARPETYDVRLYSIPWADSVPEEYYDTFHSPVFRAVDMSREIVEARAYTLADQGDSDGPRVSFSVLHDDGALVTYSCKGLSIEQVWALVEETLV